MESIERLAEKIRDLIGVLERTRGELSQTIEDNLRLSREIDDLKTRLSTAENTNTYGHARAARGDQPLQPVVKVEMTSLLDEREQIRTRVTAMLDGSSQLEEISI